MEPGILIPLAIVVIAVPLAFMWARRRFKAGTLGADGDVDPVSAPAARLTSHALRQLPTPPWRVVYEIPDDKLGGVEHVLIGAPGVFALQTSMDQLPPCSVDDPDPHVLARAAIVRGDLDDALRRCAMASERLVTVYWGAPAPDAPAAIDLLPGATGVDGRRLDEWVAGLPAVLSDVQVDLAWQTVTTAIGRPDPLA